MSNDTLFGYPIVLSDDMPESVHALAVSNWVDPFKPKRIVVCLSDGVAMSGTIEWEGDKGKVIWDTASHPRT